MTKLVFDNKYEWCGGFGAWFKSYERGAKKGEVRFIRGRLFYAAWYSHDPLFARRREINWVPVNDNTMDSMHTFRVSL